MGLGRLAVALDRPSYTIGQPVSGTVFVEAHTEIPTKSIFVKVKGKEKVKWEEHWDEDVYAGDGEERRKVGTEHHEKKYQESDGFFKLKISLGDGSSTIPPGRHAFPFRFNLPSQSHGAARMPGSFLYYDGRASFKQSRQVRHLKAKVEYSIKAVCDVDSWWRSDLSKKIDFTVYERPTSAVENPTASLTQPVMLCCCINKGDVSIVAACNKSVFHPGEHAQAKMRVVNGSTKEITPAVELNRHLEFRAHGHSISDHEMKTVGRSDPIAPGETREVTIDFVIPQDLPSTKGRCVDCHYIMDVLTEVSWAPDIEIHFPLNIFMSATDWKSHLGDVSGFVPAKLPCVVTPEPFKNGVVIPVKTEPDCPECHNKPGGCSFCADWKQVAFDT